MMTEELDPDEKEDAEEACRPAAVKDPAKGNLAEFQVLFGDKWTG